jgi:hypothetical protein
MGARFVCSAQGQQALRDLFLDEAVRISGFPYSGKIVQLDRQGFSGSAKRSEGSGDRPRGNTRLTDFSRALLPFEAALKGIERFFVAAELVV